MYQEANLSLTGAQFHYKLIVDELFKSYTSFGETISVTSTSDLWSMAKVNIDKSPLIFDWPETKVSQFVRNLRLTF
jgi:hypothetical protein